MTTWMVIGIIIVGIIILFALVLGINKLIFMFRHRDYESIESSMGIDPMYLKNYKNGKTKFDEYSNSSRSVSTAGMIQKRRRRKQRIKVRKNTASKSRSTVNFVSSASESDEDEYFDDDDENNQNDNGLVTVIDDDENDQRVRLPTSGSTSMGFSSAS